jgi:hypothetical protein
LIQEAGVYDSLLTESCRGIAVFVRRSWCCHYHW